MANLTQAPLFDVWAAATVRLAEYGRALLAEEQKEWNDPQELARWEARLIDLRLGMEKVAVEQDADKRELLLGYLQETHRLLAAYVDPLLRPLRPLLSAGGNLVVPLVLNLNGFDVVVNGFLVGMGAVLVPVAVAYSTVLAPGQSVQSIAYSGVADTDFSLDVPQPLLAGSPLYLRLFVGGTQYGRIAFPDSLLGEGFNLRVGQNNYAGVFQETFDSTLALA